MSPNSKILGTEEICKCCPLMLLNTINRSYENLTFNFLYEVCLILISICSFLDELNHKMYSMSTSYIFLVTTKALHGNNSN